MVTFYSKGNYILDPPALVEVDNENAIESLKHIGKIYARFCIPNVIIIT